MTQGLGVFQEQVSKIADLGRYEDTYIAHVAEGETVVPMDVLDSNPRLKALLFNQMLSMGIDPERYIVGNELNSINPVTGQPEFFLKKIFKSAKKALKKVAPYAGTIAGIMGLGPGYSALIGAGVPLLAGQGAGSALAGGLGGYGAGRAFGTSMFASKLPKQEMLSKIPGFGSIPGKNESTYLNFQENLSGKKASDISFKDREAAIMNNAKLDDVQKVEQINAAKQLYSKGIFSNPASIATLAATTAPLLMSGLGEDKPMGKPPGFYDIQPQSPWYGSFGTIQRAYGGDIDYEEAYADGGLSSLDEFPRMNGQISGPGGPKDDLVPAMLSDGEFVMTARAVENAGGPQAMYNLMNRLDPDSSTGTGVM
tara:strand:+ start:227 stop:1330 length:1104 start_codon:yes stop_codon:yes gene_type:complete